MCCPSLPGCVCVMAARADYSPRPVWLCGAGVFLPRHRPSPERWHRHLPFTLGETEALRRPGLHSQKLSPGPSGFPGLGPLLLVLTPGFAPAPQSHTREPSSQLSLLRWPANPKWVASLPVNSNHRPSWYAWSTMLWTFPELLKSRFMSPGNAGRVHYARCQRKCTGPG